MKPERPIPAQPDADRDELTAILKRIQTASRRATRATEAAQQAHEEVGAAVAEARAVLARRPVLTVPRPRIGATPTRGRLISWSSVRTGQTVLLRGKRTPSELTVTIAEVLPRVLGDGLGIRSTDGEVFRQYYFDVREL